MFRIALVVALVLALVLCVAVAMMFLALFRPWLRAVSSGTPVSILAILGMRLRGNPPDLIISAYTSLVYGGDAVSLQDVEAAYIANRGIIRDAQDLIEAVRMEDEPSASRM